MASPFGHNHHHHHGREDEFPPPPHDGRGEVHHAAHGGFYPEPPAVHHVSHDGSQPIRPYRDNDEIGGNRETYKIYCRADPELCLSIRHGQLILARSNPSDPHQHLYKEEKYSTRVKDDEGLPSFALVNKGTGQAIKHASAATKPVQLTEYKPDHLDESILWTESKDTGDNYKAIRMVNNISLNFDAFHGDKDHGGVQDGTTIVNWEWTKGDNQRWKIVPYYY
ncbi:unnamed protein product [Cuscuta campestris]|uniref:Ricin B lectin domain-containing protein n=1 Tax=Cuscuta campestris TaxID=132261 RepID=A0A484K791_9ASTE|nr:unnamed protein product [Cuscuta campestris]